MNGRVTACQKPCPAAGGWPGTGATSKRMREGSTRAVLGGKKHRLQTQATSQAWFSSASRRKKFLSGRTGLGGMQAASQLLCLHTASSLGSSASPAAALGWHSLPQDAAGEMGCCSDIKILLRISKSPKDWSWLSARPHQGYCQVHQAAPKFPDRFPAQLPPDGRASFPTRCHIPKNVLLSSGPRRCKTSVGYVIFQPYDNKKSLNKINFRSVFNFQCFHPSGRGKMLCFRFNLSELVKQREMHHFRSSTPFNKLAGYFQTKAGRWETKP